MPKKINAKNNGTVRQRPDGRWEARAAIAGKRRSFYADRQSDALKAMRAAQKAADDGTYLEPTRITVSAWLDTWLHEYAANTCKPLTLSTYQSRIETHIRPALGKIKLTPLSESEITAFLTELHRSEEPLSRLFRVALFTGMREGEICGLSWDAVDFASGTITVRQQLQKEKKKGGSFYIATTKNEKTRTITAAPFVMDLLREEYTAQRKARLAAGLLWKNEWNLVFTNAIEEHIVPQTALKRFKAVCTRMEKFIEKVNA